MTARIFLAKYVPDAARWEPRNVGVIVDVDGVRKARFLAEDAGGNIDGYRARWAVGAPIEVYREWVRFWRREIVERGEDPLSPDDRGPQTFFVDQAGQVLAESEPRTVDLMVDEYFGRLVHQEAQGEVELREAVESLIAATEIERRSAFKRDVTVEAEKARGAEVAERFRFPYAVQNGHLIVGHRIPLQIDAFVHDALFRFSRLPTGVEAVSFVNGFHREAHKPPVKNLEVYSRVVDVSEPTAASDLERAFEVAS